MIKQPSLHHSPHPFYSNMEGRDQIAPEFLAKVQQRFADHPGVFEQFTHYLHQFNQGQ